MQDVITTQDGGDSTTPSLGEDTTFEANPTGSLDDAFSEAFEGILDNVEAVAPSEVEEETEEPEVSGDEELDTPDDDSNVEHEVEEEEAEEVGEEASIVDFDEMKSFKFEIGGKHYSANE